MAVFLYNDCLAINTILIKGPIWSQNSNLKPDSKSEFGNDFG